MAGTPVLLTGLTVAGAAYLVWLGATGCVTPQPRTLQMPNGRRCPREPNPSRGVYAIVSAGARVVLRARPAAARLVSRFSGAAMVGIGSVLLIESFTH